MFNKICIIAKECLSENKIEEIIKFVNTNKFYKILSLATALKAGIKIPSTILLLEKNEKNFEAVVNFLNLPLMVRVDYKILSPKKVLGGIPVYSIETLRSISSFLFKKGYFPIFHPNIKRSEDKYSIGILIEPKNKEIFVEVVGEGFDASDLRLGQTIPHEHLKINLSTLSILERTLISHTLYLEQRAKRFAKSVKLLKYIEFVQKNGKLLPTLDLFDAKCYENKKSTIIIPENYIPLPDNLISSLEKIAEIIRLRVLDALPFSNNYVASLSYLPKKGWILWDIYGHWYKR